MLTLEKFNLSVHSEVWLESPVEVSVVVSSIPSGCSSTLAQNPACCPSWIAPCSSGKAERTAGIAGQDEDALVEVDVVLNQRAGGLHVV